MPTSANECAVKIKDGIQKLSQIEQEIQDVINYAVYTFPDVTQRYDMFSKMYDYLPNKLERLADELNRTGDSFSGLLSSHSDNINITNQNVTELFNTVACVKILQSEEQTKAQFHTVVAQKARGRKRKLNVDENDQNRRGGGGDFLDKRIKKVDLSKPDFASNILDDTGVVINISDDMNRKMALRREEILRQQEEERNRGKKKRGFLGWFGNGSSADLSVNPTPQPHTDDTVSTDTVSDDETSDTSSKRSMDDSRRPSISALEGSIARRPSTDDLPPLPKEKPKVPDMSSPDLPPTPRIKVEQPVASPVNNTVTSSSRPKSPNRGKLPDLPFETKLPPKPTLDEKKTLPPRPALEEKKETTTLPPKPTLEKKEALPLKPILEESNEKTLPPKPSLANKQSEQYEWEVDFDTAFDRNNSTQAPPAATTKIETPQKPIK
ncbi:Ttn, partial [Acrasis kona]